MGIREQIQLANENRGWAIRFYGIILAASLVIGAFLLVVDYYVVVVAGVHANSYYLGFLLGVGFLVFSLGVALVAIALTIWVIDIEYWPDEMKNKS